MKKREIQPRKLRLFRETLRALQEADLPQVAAGGGTEGPGGCASTETGLPCIAAAFAPGCFQR